MKIIKYFLISNVISKMKIFNEILKANLISIIIIN